MTNHLSLRHQPFLSRLLLLQQLHIHFISLLIIICLSSSSSLLAPTLGQPSPPLTRVIYNSSGILPAGSSFQFLTDVLPGGWSRAGLCGNNVDDCSLHLRVEQISPDPTMNGCGMEAELQVSCQCQTSPAPLTLPLMVCVTPTSTSNPYAILFPQDSPAVGWTTTIPLTLTPDGMARDSSSASSTASNPFNPAHITLSPARFASLERVAIRNTVSAEFEIEHTATATKRYSIYDHSLFASNTSATLPVRIVLITPSSVPSTCPDITYFVSLEVVHNQQCRNQVVYPSYSIVIPATNTTNSSTVIVPGWNQTAPVLCASMTGTCVVTNTNARDPSILPTEQGNFTSVCSCDPGFSSSTSGSNIGSDCLANLGTDLVIPQARPYNPLVNQSIETASMAWLMPNNQSVKGAMLEFLQVNLNQSVIPPTHSSTTSTPALELTDYFSSYYYGRLNLSRSMTDLALTFHITVHESQTSFLPIQVQFSEKYYPTIQLNTPLSCLNGSDLQQSNLGPANYAPSSCASLFQQFPDQTSLPTATTFKLFFHPTFLQGFMNQSITAGLNDGEQMTLYFSIYFQQQMFVDIRAWFQEDLQIILPQAPKSPPMSTSSATPPSSTSAYSSSSSLSPPISSPNEFPLPYIPYLNQSWIQFARENEVIYFQMNETGPAPELASLYVLINDTNCVTGGLTRGYYAPHWWLTSDPNEALVLGKSSVGLYELAQPPVFGITTPMAISGGCIRPNQRYDGSFEAAAGWFGELHMACESYLEVSIWHVPPVTLSMDTMGTYTPASLNATGSTCWREFILDITTSVQNDLIVVVDQEDAVIYFRQGAFPTPTSYYNSTTQIAIGALDGDGGASTWQQHSIAYADLSHGAQWFIGIYFDPTPGSTVPHPGRNFRVQLSWQQDSSFNHLSPTFIILLSCGGAVVAILMMIALKMRIDACRRQRSNKSSKLKTSVKMQQEKSRLVAPNTPGKQENYTRL